jgi:beta-galactosidase
MRVARGSILLLVAVSLLRALVAAPQPLAEVEEEHRVSPAFVTPHTAWAKPYAQGTVRVLFFGENGRWDTLGREPAELAQRFDLAIDVVYSDFRKQQDPGGRWAGAEVGEQRMLRLLDQRYDVYLFLHVSPRNLPAASRAKLLAAVRDGAGLVMIGTDDRPASRLRAAAEAPAGPEDEDDLFADNTLLRPEDLQVTAPAALAGVPQTSVYLPEQGRAVRLPGRPAIPYAPGWEAEYDYWEAQVGRAVLWAAGREPRAALSIDLPARAAWDALPAITARWQDAPAGATLALRARRQDGRTLDLGTREVAAAGTLRLELPPLPAGTHHVDAFLRGPKGAETWASAPMTVACPRNARVTLAQNWGEIGDAVSGTVTLDGAPLPNERIAVQLVDRRGRILARQDTAGPFRFTLERGWPMLLRVEAVLCSGDREVTSAYDYVHVTQRRHDQFNLVMWDCPLGTGAAYAQEALARNGVTVVLGQGNPRLEQGAYDIAWIPYTTYIKNDVENETRPTAGGGCWNDAARQDRFVADTAAKHLPARQHGVFVYSLGDEGSTYGACLQPDCLSAYRQYLRESYGTIAALNAAWGTTYKDFAAVELSTVTKKGPDGEEEALPDNGEETARKTGNYPRWYDRTAFQRWNLINYCRRFADVYRKMDPQARTGFEGSGGATFGLDADVELLVKTLQFWGPYPSQADELVRALAPRGLVRSNWTGYAKNADGLLADYWRTLTRGADSIFFWMCTGVGGFHGFLASDLSPYAATQALIDDTRIVRDGLGDLLLKSTRLDDGIAFLYGMPSECIAGQGDGAAFGLSSTPGNYGNYNQNLTTWQQAIHSLGMEFTYVTDRALAAAPLDPKRYKVLILPQAEALGDATAAAVRAYAAAGGTVIADVRPGLYTEHGQPRTTGCLDALFGITRREAAKAVVADLKIEGTLAGTALSLAWSAAEARAHGEAAAYGPRVDPAVRAATGTALGMAGETPLCVVRPVGKGRAILLNFCLAGSFALRTAKGTRDVPEPFLRFLGPLLAAAGVAPAVRVTDAQGQPVRNLEVIRWQNGAGQLLCLLRQRGDTETARLILPAPQHVTDLRAGKSLGTVATVDVPLIRNHPAWFAVQPAPDPPARLTLAGPAVPGATLHATLDAPGATTRHAYRLRLLDPNSKETDWLPRVAITPADIALPIALNEQPGTWTLEAVDLLGETVRTAFTVPKAP